MYLYSKESMLLQTIFFDDYFHGIDFLDVNFDDFDDIIINTGGTLNESHELYTWDISSQRLAKVTFCGFETLSNYEVHDGYLINWVKESASTGVMQKLIWDKNMLVLLSSEPYELEE